VPLEELKYLAARALILADRGILSSQRSPDERSDIRDSCIPHIVALMLSPGRRFSFLEGQLLISSVRH
jgi:hypothetical protein